MLIQTSRFGEIEVEENQVITFPSGLVGFSEDRRFVIREDNAAAPFLWLQSVDNNGLAFVMIEPHVSVSNYELALTQEHLKKLDANNLEKRLGLQFIIPNGKYSTRHLLFGDKLKDNNQEEPSSKTPEEQQ